MGFDSQGQQQWQPQQPQPGPGQPQYPYQQQLPPAFPPGYAGQPNAQGWYPPPAAPAGRQPSARTYKTAARRQKSTAVHGILTVLTAGLWSPVWIMACAENARIRKAQAEVAMIQTGDHRPAVKTVRIPWTAV